MNGTRLTTLREGDKQIPIVARLRMEERAPLSDIHNLYVYSAHGPAEGAARGDLAIDYGMQTEKLQRRNQFRTITVSAFPAAGHLPSEVLNAAMPRARRSSKRSLPPGYRLEIGGEHEEQVKGFGDLAIVMVISVGDDLPGAGDPVQHAVKPLIVFAAIPYGMSARWRRCG